MSDLTQRAGSFGEGGMAVEVRIARWLARKISPELRDAVRDRLRRELRDEIRASLLEEIQENLREEAGGLATGVSSRLTGRLWAFELRMSDRLDGCSGEKQALAAAEELSTELRALVRRSAGLKEEPPGEPDIDDLLAEFSCLVSYADMLRPVFERLRSKRVLYAGQAYYNAWYLSRALRRRGWKADVLNWDLNPDTQIYYHGQDISFDAEDPNLAGRMIAFYLHAIYAYDLFHFSNANGIAFGWPVANEIARRFGDHAEIHLLKALGKKIVYSNNGCQDGVAQSSFASWGDEPVCDICRWKNVPEVCSDERNLAWGRFRNHVADYQCLLGGNRKDWNNDPRVHEVPEFFCLDPEVWKPDLQIPEKFRLPVREGVIRLYHAVGHYSERTNEDGVNIKSSHIYLPLVEQLKREGWDVELLSPEGVPNRDVRYIQAQADIFLEMLSFGWFGANAREAMMLGKPVICYIRPEWLENVRRELPEYADELPIVSATPATVKEVLLDLMKNEDKRREIGRRSREFAMKWHSSDAGAVRMAEIYERVMEK